jgi:carboxyl-terminal processing protease
MNSTTAPRRLIIVVATLLMLVSGVCAQTRPDPHRNKQIMRMVAAYLAQAHLSNHKLDDEISARAFDALLETLDPLKLYLMQSDIDEFSTSRHEFDDLLLEGDSSVADAMWQRYITRLGERVREVPELLKQEFDFTKDERFVTDYKTATWPKTQAQARERWRRRVKYDLLQLKADDVEPEECVKRLTRRYASLERRMRQLDAEDVLSMFITTITTGYDPHTTYMSPRRLENFEIHMRLNYQGIGARLNDIDGYAEVFSIMPGGAVAKQGGLIAGDRIVGVAQGKDGAFEDVVGMRLNDVVDRIRGKEGTLVRLKISPAGGGKERIAEIIRARTELLDEKAVSAVFDVDTAGGKKKIGVIDLPSFYGNMGSADNQFRSATRDVLQFIDEFKKQGVDAIVLDLRLNGGGLLAEAVSITGLFIDQGPVVQVKGFGGRVRTRDDREPGVAWNGPLVVLTSKFSASASEIVAGAIQDYRRGIVVGDQSTHGKGTVQQVLELGRPMTRGSKPQELGALKLTIQKFYRPGGLSTQQRGVRSDLVVPSITNEISDGEAGERYAVDFDSIDAKEHRDYGMLDKSITEQLRARSDKRTGASAWFQRQARMVELYRKRKMLKSVTLNLKEYRAMIEQFADSDKEAKKAVADSEKREVKRDEFIDEVLQIAAEYDALLGPKLAQIGR